MVILQVFRMFIAENQINTRIFTMITNNKIIEIFCAIDEFCKNFDVNRLRISQIHFYVCSALAAHCFFENKPQALPVCVQNTR